MQKRKSVSLQQIADRAGVSKATVSLALKGHPRISKTTKEKIKFLAKEMGYRPNPHLSKLMSSTKKGPLKDQGTLGFIRSGPTEEWNPVEQKIFSKLTEITDSRGYQLESFWLNNPDTTPERINRIMWTRGIEGIIIPMIHPEMFHQGVRTLPVEWDKFCAVEFSDTLMVPRISGVRHNHFRGMLTTLAELEADGYKRIGLTMWQDVELRTHHRWSAAYLLWKQLRGVMNELPIFVPEEYDANALLAWIDKNRLDVVVSPGQEVYRMLLQEGIKFPKDLGYATLDQWGEGSEDVTGINQDMESQLQTMMDILIGQIHRAERGTPEHPVFALNPGFWCSGSTTRSPKKRPVVRHLDQEPLSSLVSE